MNHDPICKHTPFPEKTALLRSANAALKSDTELGISRLTGRCYGCKKLIANLCFPLLLSRCSLYTDIILHGSMAIQVYSDANMENGQRIASPDFLVILLSAVVLAHLVERMALGILQWHPITIEDRLAAERALEKIRCDNLLVDVYVYGGSVFSAHVIASLLCG